MSGFSGKAHFNVVGGGFGADCGSEFRRTRGPGLHRAPPPSHYPWTFLSLTHGMSQKNAPPSMSSLRLDAKRPDSRPALHGLPIRKKLLDGGQAADVAEAPLIHAVTDLGLELRLEVGRHAAEQVAPVLGVAQDVGALAINVV